MIKNRKDSSGKEMDLKVSIRNRRKILYEGTAFSLTSYNALGEFSVLPQHANFISLIKDKVILDKGRPDEMVYEIEKGLISVDESNVSIYTGIGIDEVAKK